MIKRTWYIILPALLIIQFVSGQDYIFKRYNASDGLINNVLLDITQDSYGFLWLPTVSGLSSFDGKNFKNYSFTEGLQNLVVNKIFEDSRHRLWIGTAKGIAQLKGNRFKMYTDKAPGENLILGFGEYKEWGILAFTEAGIFRLENDSTWIKTDVLHGYKGKNCLDIAETEDGMYLNYEDEVVFKKKNGIFVVLLKDTTDNAESYCNGLVKKDGKLFAGVRNQLYQLSEGKATLIIDSIPIRNFFNYTVDTANTFWVNTGGSGLYKYQLKQNKKIVSVYHYESNSNGFPFVDHQGNLWITSFEGLIRVSPKIFEDLSPPVLQGAEKRMNIIPGTFDDVVLSDETGLNVIRNGSIQKLKRPVSYRDDKSYSNDIVEGYAKDRMGNTWLMTRQRKLLCWNGTQLSSLSLRFLKWEINST